MVSTTCEGDVSRGWFVWRMKERASFTNAVVSTAPAPIRNPRRDCSIKNPPEWHTHLEDWRPTVAHAGHIVVPPLPVKAGWRDRQVLSGCNGFCYHRYPHCQRVNRKAILAVPNRNFSPAGLRQKEVLCLPAIVGEHGTSRSQIDLS